MTAEPERVTERQHTRYAHEVAIRVRLAGAKSQRAAAKVIEGRTVNMSRGGLCATVGHAIAIGTEVILDMTLVFDDDMQSEALTLAARVAWCTNLGADFQIGVSFKPMSAETAQFVEMFLRYLGEERAPRAPRVEKSIDDQFR